MKPVAVAGGVALAALMLAACSPKSSTQASNSGAPAASAPSAGAAAPSAQDQPGPEIPVSQIPQIRGGWWEETRTSPGKPRHVDHTCQSGKTKPIKSPKECSKFSLHRSLLGKYVFDGQCGGPGMAMSFHVEAAGDFQTHYSVDSAYKVNIQNRGETADTEHTEARYVGACPAGEAPAEDPE